MIDGKEKVPENNEMRERKEKAKIHREKTIAE
jgi:hypothetical protein